MPFIKESFQISAPQRVIAFLRQILQLSMKDAQKFVDKGRVEQNGEVVRDKTRALQGEVSVSHFKAVDLGIAPIFEAPDFVAFDKPAGLLSHPKGRFWHFSLLDAVRFHLGSEANLINRLDYETSGLVLVSKNKKSETELKTLFETRRVEKSYLAVVEGKVDSADFIIDLSITEGKMGSDLGIRSRVCESGKPSQTAVKILHYDCKKNQTLLKVTPLTGRTHQIRVHLAHIGHRIVGDGLYGTSDERAREFLAQKASNLSWGMRFRTCKNFWTSTDSSLVDSPKISTNTKATPPLLRLFVRFCDSQNLGVNQAKIAESNKNSPSLAEGARGWVDSANNNLSLRDSASQNLHNSRCDNAINPAESSAESRLMLHAQSLRFCYKNKEYFIYAPPAEFCTEF